MDFSLSEHHERTDDIRQYDRHRRIHFVFFTMCLGIIAGLAIVIYSKWSGFFSSQRTVKAYQAYRWGFAAGIFPLAVFVLAAFMFYATKSSRRKKGGS